MAALALAGAGFGWWTQPRTAEELFQARCSACHALPDLSGYRRANMAAIVDTMRHRNGAHALISESEAQAIVRYLEALKKP